MGITIRTYSLGCSKDTHNYCLHILVVNLDNMEILLFANKLSVISLPQSLLKANFQVLDIIWHDTDRTMAASLCLRRGGGHLYTCIPMCSRSSQKVNTIIIVP